MHVYIVNNIDVSNSGGIPVDFDSLVDMSYFEDVTSIVDSLQGLQHLY